jgi:NAD-dependent deacetylase
MEDLATPSAFARDPALVHAFYNARRARLRDAEVQPNAAHLALAELERRWTGEFLLVTQNVDNLHERAGSTAPLHMHGELLKARCRRCLADVPWSEDLGVGTACPRCTRVGHMRPHVVWFGEQPLDMARIGVALEACTLFVAIGTSGHVYPAAGFVEAVRARARTIELNLERSRGFNLFHECHLGPATETVPAFVAKLLGEAHMDKRHID